MAISKCRVIIPVFGYVLLSTSSFEDFVNAILCSYLEDEAARGISNCNYDVRGSIRSAHDYWKVRSLYQPGKLGNAFKDANSTQQYPNSTQQYPTVPNSTQQYPTVPPRIGGSLRLVVSLHFLPSRQHTGPGSTQALATHRPWQHTGPGNTKALALELYTFPAWQHTCPGTGVVYFPPPGSTQDR